MGDTQNFQNYLENLNTWEEDINMPDNIPDGKYELELVDTQLAVSSTDRIMVRRHHSVIGGPFDGFPVFDQFILDVQFAAKNFKKWVEALGYVIPIDPKQIEELVDTISQEQVGTAFQGTVKTSKSGFANVTIIGQIPSNSPGFATQPATQPAPINTPAAPAIARATQTTAPVVPQASGDVKRIPPKPVAIPSVLPSIDSLRMFAVSQGFVVGDDHSIDQVIEAIKSDAYQKAALLPEEVKLLQAIGATITE